MRLIDLHDEKKRHAEAALYWRGLYRRAKEGTRERTRTFLMECCETNLREVAELRIQDSLEAGRL